MIEIFKKPSLIWKILEFKTLARQRAVHLSLLRKEVMIFVDRKRGRSELCSPLSRGPISVILETSGWTDTGPHCPAK